MALPFTEFVPEAQRQQQRFEQVFGKDVSQNVENKATNYGNSFTNSRRRNQEIARREAEQQAFAEREAEIRETERRQLAEEAERQRELERQEAEARKQEMLKREDLSQRVLEYSQKRSTVDSFTEIQPFSTIFSPNPSRRDLGAEKPFTQRLGSAVGREARFLTGSQTKEDFSTSQGLFVPVGLENEFVSSVPTGTDITGGGQKSRRTFKEEAQFQFVAGGLGKPIEFELQEVQKGVVSSGRRNLEKDRDDLQKAIDSGLISVEGANVALEMKREQRMGEIEKEFGSIEQNVRFRRGTSEPFVSSFREAEKGLDVEPLVKGAAIGTGFLVAPELAPTALISLGSAEMFSSVARPTKGERESKIIEGAFDVGFGFATFGSAARSSIYGARGEQRFSQTIKEPFTEKNPIDVKVLKQGDTGGFVYLKGSKTKFFDQGDLVNLNFNLEETFVKTPKGSISVSKEGLARTTGKIDLAPIDYEGIFSKGQTFNINKVQKSLLSGSTVDKTEFGDVMSGFRTNIYNNEGEIRRLVGFSDKTGKNTFKVKFGGTYQRAEAKVRLETEPIFQYNIKDPNVAKVEIFEGEPLERSVRISRFQKLAKANKGSIPDIVSFKEILKPQKFKPLEQPKSFAGSGTSRPTSGLRFNQQLLPQKFVEDTEILPAFQDPLGRFTTTIEQPKSLSSSNYKIPKLGTGDITKPRNPQTTLTRTNENFGLPSFGFSEMTNTITTPKPKTRSSTYFSTSTVPFQNVFQPTSQIPKLGIKQGELERPKNILEQTTDVPPPSNPIGGYDFNYRGNFDRFGFGLPISIPHGYPTKPQSFVTRKRSLKRTPSLAAATFGFTSSKPVRGEKTGIVERPILTKPKKMKKLKLLTFKF